MSILERERRLLTPFKAYLCFAVILFIFLELSMTITFQAQIVKDDTDPLQIINKEQILHPVILKNVGETYGIHLIGERHSGTNWITDHLKACFGHAVPVRE
jgi:ABC-type microcin C transport system permease subunit YejE